FGAQARAANPIWLFIGLPTSLKRRLTVPASPVKSALGTYLKPCGSIMWTCQPAAQRRDWSPGTPTMQGTRAPCHEAGQWNLGSSPLLGLSVILQTCSAGPLPVPFGGTESLTSTCPSEENTKLRVVPDNVDKLLPVSAFQAVHQAPVPA